MTTIERSWSALSSLSDATPALSTRAELEAWLACFPSFGFLLAVAPAQLAALQQLIAPYPDLLCAEIGAFASGASELVLHQGGQRHSFWRGQEPLTGFGALA